MISIDFTIPGDPVGKGRPRAFVMKGHGIRMYTPKKTVSYENLVKLACQNVYSGSPIEGPLRLRISAFFSIPKSMKKSDRTLAEVEGLYVTKKPDADNIMKCVSDALNGIAFKDDAQVCEARVLKAYSKNPRVVVSVTSISY